MLSPAHTAYTDRDRQAIESAMTGRRSIRAYTDRAVPHDLVSHILDVSARAPSGTNMQPWRAHVLAGDAKTRLSAAVTAAFDTMKPGDLKSEYKYYPDQFFEPFLSRRRKVGLDMYGLLGIAKGDHAAMHAQHGQNFTFFGAPVGIIFTINRRLEIGSWLDYGMFLQNVMLCARGHGLETCPQAAFAMFHDIIRKELGLDETEMVVCGLSLGWPDHTATINKLTTERMPAAEFSTFRGFGEAG